MEKNNKILKNLAFITIPYYCLEMVKLDFTSDEINKKEIELLKNCTKKTIGSINIVSKVFESTIQGLDEDKIFKRINKEK